MRASWLAGQEVGQALFSVFLMSEGEGCVLPATGGLHILKVILRV